VRVDVNGVGIEYEVTGDGPPVVLLHGFPDSGRLWRHQVPALAEAGSKVIVPDMRGYGRSDKPTEVEAYTMDLPPERFRQSILGLPPVKAPTMGVWSSEDPALTEGQMIRSASQVAGPWRYERLDGPGHWLQLEAPSEVNRLLIDFLAA
jgi:pimeloyl-ACP methyl ester carboxylesterase